MYGVMLEMPGPAMRLQQFVVQEVFESKLAKFFNQKPEKAFFVRRFVGSAIFLTAVSGAVSLGPYGILASVVLIPVLKEVAKRVATIGANCAYHGTLVAKHRIVGNQNERSFADRIHVLMETETETSPLVVSCFGAVVGEAVWACFVAYPTPIVVSGVAKDALKGLVAAPCKQLGKAAAQYGFNTIFGVSAVDPRQIISVEDAFIDMACDCGATAATDLTCRRVACSFFAKFALFSLGLELGRALAIRAAQIATRILIF